VQALCDRVVVINKGQIVADEKLENLMHTHARAAVVIEFESAVPEDDLRQLPGVDGIEAIDTRSYRILPAKGVDVRAEIFRFAAERKLALVGLRQEENSLEAIFRELTV
jgi:ABC-2 type transport system ATP-binding protein